jgi:hypothetical protein
MAEWWESAPLAQPAKSSSANWWDHAPLAEPPAAEAPPQRGLMNAITDIPGEIYGAGAEAVHNIAGIANRGGKGPIEGLMSTGRAMLGVPQLMMAPVTGAARAIGGNLMTQAEHAAGQVINPAVAAKDDLNKMYETAKGDVDTAMSAARPAGAPMKAPVPASGPALPGTPPPLGPAEWQWQAPTAAASAPTKAPTPSIQDLKDAASAAYKSPEVKGLEVKSSTLGDYSNTTAASLNNEGFDDITAPKTFGLLNKLQQAPAGAKVTGDNLNSLRKAFGKVAMSTDPAERAAAGMAIEHIDNFIPNLRAADVLSGDPVAAAAKLEEARGNYAAAKQSEKIDQKLVQAEVRAAAANSGMNVANTIRQRMADVVLKPKEARGLLPEEIEQAQAISEGTKAQNLMRTAGNMMGGGGGIGAAVVGAGAGIATGGPGAVLPLVGMALKSISNRMTIKQAERLSEAIRSRAPLASSAAKLQQAAAQTQGNRTPQAMAGLAIAARNLATNLRGAGFDVSATDLVRGIQSPSMGRTDDQDQIPRPPGQ